MKSAVAQKSVDVRNLPMLKGSKKQLEWAYKIRNGLCGTNPDAEILTTETEAKFWIENRFKLLGDEAKSIRKLRELSGTEKQIKYAFAIRSKFAEIFSESPLLNSQTEAKFWIENRQIFDYAILGFKSAPAKAVGETQSK